MRLQLYLIVNNVHKSTERSYVIFLKCKYYAVYISQHKNTIMQKFNHSLSLTQYIDLTSARIM